MNSELEFFEGQVTNLIDWKSLQESNLNEDEKNFVSKIDRNFINITKYKNLQKSLIYSQVEFDFDTQFLKNIVQEYVIEDDWYTCLVSGGHFSKYQQQSLISKSFPFLFKSISNKSDIDVFIHSKNTKIYTNYLDFVKRFAKKVICDDYNFWEGSPATVNHAEKKYFKTLKVLNVKDQIINYIFTSLNPIEVVSLFDFDYSKIFYAIKFESIFVHISFFKIFQLLCFKRGLIVKRFDFNKFKREIIYNLMAKLKKDDFNPRDLDRKDLKFIFSKFLYFVKYSLKGFCRFKKERVENIKIIDFFYRKLYVFYDFKLNSNNSKMLKFVLFSTINEKLFKKQEISTFNDFDLSINFRNSLNGEIFQNLPLEIIETIFSEIIIQKLKDNTTSALCWYGKNKNVIYNEFNKHIWEKITYIPFSIFSFLDKIENNYVNITKFPYYKKEIRHENIWLNTDSQSILILKTMLEEFVLPDHLQHCSVVGGYFSLYNSHCYFSNKNVNLFQAFLKKKDIDICILHGEASEYNLIKRYKKNFKNKSLVVRDISGSNSFFSFKVSLKNDMILNFILLNVNKNKNGIPINLFTYIDSFDFDITKIFYSYKFDSVFVNFSNFYHINSGSLNKLGIIKCDLNYYDSRFRDNMKFLGSKLVIQTNSLRRVLSRKWFFSFKKLLSIDFIRFIKYCLKGYSNEIEDDFYRLYIINFYLSCFPKLYDFMFDEENEFCKADLHFIFNDFIEQELNEKFNIKIDWSKTD